MRPSYPSRLSISSTRCSSCVRSSSLESSLVKDDATDGAELSDRTVGAEHEGSGAGFAGTAVTGVRGIALFAWAGLADSLELPRTGARMPNPWLNPLAEERAAEA